MGMLLRVTVTGKIQISLRLLRSPLLDLSRKCLLSRETLRPGGSIGVFTHHPLLYSPPTPRKPILPAVQRKVSWFYRSFTVVLSSIRDGYFRKWRDCTYTFQVTTYPGSFQKFSNEISTGYAFPLVNTIQCRIHFEDRKIYFVRTTDCLFVMCVTFSQWKPDPDTDSGKWCPRIEFSSSSNWKISLYCLASIVVGEPVGEENFCASWIDDNGNNWKLILYDRCTNC